MNKNALIKDYHITPNPKNNYLAIKVINGLGNRMRAYAFYKALAGKLNRKLLLCWTKTIGFDDTHFNSFFSNEENLITEKEFNKIRGESINLNDFIQLSKCKQYEENEGNVYNEGTHRKEVVANLKKYNFNIWNFKLANNCNLPLSIITSNLVWPTFLGIENEFIYELRNLKLNEYVKQLVEHSVSKYSKHTYGMHIRKGDVMDAKNPDSLEYLESHDDNYFIKIIEDIISKNKNARFFLATDCKRTSNNFKKRFRNHIIENDLKSFHESKYNEVKGGQIDALADMYCLSRTKKIFGTTWSTFSWVANVIGDIKLILK